MLFMTRAIYIFAVLGDKHRLLEEGNYLAGAVSPDSPASATSPEQDDIAALAKGGRVNFFGFLLRLAARLPFLFVAGRVYGAETLGRFAYAVLVVAFAAQLATLGLKRGLAGEPARTKRPPTHVVYDAVVLH